MPALFPRWSNTAFRLALAALLVFGASLVFVPMLYVRTPYNTQQFVALEQPVQFDHRHHVRDDGIDCLYCHSAAERSATAGIPATEVCMGCHSQIWNESPLLEPVRQSYFSGVPIPWQRVHRLPDFAYFNHSVHVNQGIGCVRCHGRVDQMAGVYQVAPLTMSFCLECHRDPAGFMGQHPAPLLDFQDTASAFADQLTGDLARDRSLTRLTSCTACHR